MLACVTPTNRATFFNSTLSDGERLRPGREGTWAMFRKACTGVHRFELGAVAFRTLDFGQMLIGCVDCPSC